MTAVDTKAPLAWTVHGPQGHEVARVTWTGGEEVTIAAQEEMAYFLRDELEPLLKKPDLGAALNRYFDSVPELSKGRFSAKRIPRFLVRAKLRLEAEAKEKTGGQIGVVHKDARARYLHNTFPSGLDPVALCEWTRRGKVVWEPTGFLGRPVYHAEGGVDGNAAHLSISSPKRGMYRLLVTIGYEGVPERSDEYDGPAGLCTLGALWHCLELGSDI